MRILEPFENYYWDFYKSQSKTVQKKIDYVLQIIITIEQIPQKFFKHIEDGIYEIRIKSGSDIYRIFSFFDEGKLVILLHGVLQRKLRNCREKK